MGPFQGANQQSQHAMVLMPNQLLLLPPSHHQATATSKASRRQLFRPQTPPKLGLPMCCRTTLKGANQPGQIPLWTQTLPQQQPIGPPTLTDLRTDTTLMDRAAQLVSTNTQEQPDTSKNPKSGLKCDNTEQVTNMFYVILANHPPMIRLPCLNSPRAICRSWHRYRELLPS